MERSPDLTESLVLGYLQNAPKAVSIDTIAQSLGLGFAITREALRQLADRDQVERVAGARVLYRVKKPVALPVQAHWKREWTPDPEFLRRAEEAQEHRRRFPSKHV